MIQDFDKAKKLFNAAGTLGSGTILKALEKFIPGVGQFTSGAFAAGYAADQILDFVKDKLENPSARRNRQQLESRADQGVARPDELASLSQMEQQRAPLNVLGGLGKLGAQAAGGAITARAGAEQAANEQALQQQQLQLQQEANQQRQAQQDQNLQRLAQQDQLQAIRRQQEEQKRKEDLGFKQRAEERAIERHKASLSKPAVSSSLKKEIPQNHADALRELHELINRLP